MDALTRAAGVLGGLLILGGAGVLLAGAAYGLEERIAIDGEAAELREDGYVQPSRSAVTPNETIEITYAIENDRPIPWEGRVLVYADALDGRRQEVDLVLLDEQVELEPGESRTFTFSLTPRELGYTSPNPEGFRGNGFSLHLQGPGPEHWMRFIVTEERPGRGSP